ncbi:MAG TPA: iron ABC transporter permease [Fimbriimonadaceae bacterium]|nr:iron ABC transporter permease [Fimbriimonadaceae bacterium]HRJ32665.1 iron ABC transporter permease [Fimbriimonadaceae bacterium]
MSSPAPISKRVRNQRSWWGLGLGVLFLMLVHLGVGSSMWIPPLDVLRELISGQSLEPSVSNVIVWELRLPRALACVLVGAILGMTGAAFQAVFRNPLAEPYVIGVSSGAAVGGVLAIVAGLSGLMAGLGGMLLSMAGGLVSLFLVLAWGRVRGVLVASRLLLAGVMLGLLLSSVMTVLLLASGADSNRVLRWLLGAMTPIFWERIAILSIVGFGGAILLVRESRRLNALAMSEDAATSLGLEPPQVMRRVLIIGTLLTATAVGAVGIIGFLGLVAPHAARLVVGPDLRRAMPLSGILGAGLLLIADLLAQRALPGTELPVGAVTALLGAPILLGLLRKSGTGSSTSFDKVDRADRR